MVPLRVRMGDEVVEMRSVEYEDGTVKLIDQRDLPEEIRIFRADTLKKVAYAIREMVVRGAPAIGITAAYGMAGAYERGEDLYEARDVLAGTRPTAHDLFYALDRMLEAYKAGRDVVEEAIRYAEEIVERCRRIGEVGEPLIEDGYRILTHCNAGALAVADWGTALAPMRMAHRKGKRIFVWVDETRPRLQGARLTAWELLQEGIDHAVLADNAAGFFMWRGEVDLVIVGADRIAANGDVANKIGTYEKAVVAHENGIPFYVAAPISTFDLRLKTGKEIPIEERSEDEVLEVRGRRVAPLGSSARNPAFDVTPAKYITGIITEMGVIRPEDVRRVVR